VATSNRKTAAKEGTDAVAPEQDPPVEQPVDPIAPEPDAPVKDDDGETPEQGSFTILNPGTSSVAYTEDARQIEPGQRITVTDLDEAGQAALDRGYIVKID
jgi:hypothetical protein